MFEENNRSAKFGCVAVLTIEAPKGLSCPGGHWVTVRVLENDEHDERTYFASWSFAANRDGKLVYLNKHTDDHQTIDYAILEALAQIRVMSEGWYDHFGC